MAGTWSVFSAPTQFNVDTPLLLTDGSVMCHEDGTPNWFKLTPDASGNYVNGTWSALAPMLRDPIIPAAKGGPTYAPLYFASAVLKDGTVLIAGGEYNSGIKDADLLSVQLYDPVSDSWGILPPPPTWGKIGDAPSCVLSDGRFLLGSIDDTKTAIYDPVRKAWTAAATKGDPSNEETWTLLPDGTVLTVQCQNGQNAEKYIASLDQWVGAGSTPSILPQACTGLVAEIGPAVLLPDGRVFAIGATGNTALYTPPSSPSQTGSWAAGPTLQDSGGNIMYPMDAPAVLLPNGRVLCVGSPGPPCNYPPPTMFFEYDPATNMASQVSSPLNLVSASYPCFTVRLLLLPSGQILFSNGTTDVEFYSPDPGLNAAWKPTVISFPSLIRAGQVYPLSGLQLNGLSQAVSYGDDAQMATNYPIVRLRNLTSGAVAFGRTFNHSTMAVATGNLPQTTNVQIPTSLQSGTYELVVIANGIPSTPIQAVIA